MKTATLFKLANLKTTSNTKNSNSNHHEESELGLAQFDVPHQDVQVVPLVPAAVSVEVERLVHQLLPPTRHLLLELVDGARESHGQLVLATRLVD